MVVGQGLSCGASLVSECHQEGAPVRIVDGLVAEEWICSDMATMNAQLTADRV
jgi:hypothetical protein